MSKTNISEIKEKMQKDPYANLLGIKLEEVKEGYAKVSIRLKREFGNFSGYIHGGLIFSLADQAFAAASNSRGKLSVGIHMDINYVKTPSLEDNLVAEATEEHVSSRIGLYLIKVRDSHQSLIAEAQGMVYRRK